MNATDSPSEGDFLEQARQALPVVLAHCSCPDRWHLLWAANKATGLMRGMHLQQACLQGLLLRHLNPNPRVLIGGAADTGALDVLCSAIHDPGVHYRVVDLCPAPLLQLGARAAALGVPLETQQIGLDAVRAAHPWDLVFVHYTLGFMTREQRLRFLRQARADLATGGVVVCAVREKQAPATLPADLPAQQAQRAAEWARQAAARFAPVCAGRPEWLAALLDWAPAYALSRMAREDAMPSFETVCDEFAACGFTLRESHRNPGEPPRRDGDVSAPGTITNWLAVFSPA